MGYGNYFRALECEAKSISKLSYFTVNLIKLILFIGDEVSENYYNCVIDLYFFYAVIITQ